MSGEEIFMISVIVPVYNTAGYVGRCIDSVLHSSCQDFELILVNDGSSDSSPEICREYCRRDSRIRLIGQEHEGVSAARNRGIEASRGEWIVFVDSDDFISDDFLGMVMQKENQGCELLIFDYALSKKKAGKRASRHTRAYREGGFRPIRYKETDRLKLVESLLYGRQIVGGGSTSLISPWAKAYKKSVIDHSFSCGHCAGGRQDF